MEQSRFRAVAIINAVVLVIAVLSIGQIRYYERSKGSGSSVLASDPSGLVDPATPSQSATAAPSGTAAPSSSAKPAATTPGSVRTGGSIPGVSSGGGLDHPPAHPPVNLSQVPDFGLRTQGVTATTVKLGMDYGKSGCNGSDALANQFSKSVTGDPDKAATAFTNHINDTGGIRGKKLQTVLVDDGGEGCPDKQKAAEIELVNTHKVFMDVAGLHGVSDLLAKDHVPYMGGRSSKREQVAAGYGQFQLFQDADSDFANWASFGKNYINSAVNTPCFAHPDTADFNNLEPILVNEMSKQGLKFKVTVRYADDASSAAQQAANAALQMSQQGCKQVWLVANNAIADIFFTNAAKSYNWYPTWTWTARTALIDQQLGGSLMQQDEWENSIGLTTRILPGQSPYEGKCASIYKKYYNGDGQENSAATLAACVGILTSSEAMRRAVDLTGVLDANTLMLGVNAIKGDWWFDSHVPITYTVPPPALSGKDFDFTGYDLQTVAKWNRNKGDYDFPAFPTYWKVMGPGKSGGVDIRAALRKTYTPPQG